MPCGNRRLCSHLLACARRALPATLLTLHLNIKSGSSDFPLFIFEDKKQPPDLLRIIILYQILKILSIIDIKWVQIIRQNSKKSFVLPSFLIINTDSRIMSLLLLTKLMFLVLFLCSIFKDSEISSRTFSISFERQKDLQADLHSP